MTQNEFSQRLKQALKGLPHTEISRTLHYYSEIIADRMEEGMTEEDAVGRMEPVETIAARVLEENRSGLGAPRRGAFQTVLLVLGFPLWFPLLAAGAVLLVAAFAVIWVLVLCLWVSCLGLFAWGLGSLLSLIWYAAPDQMGLLVRVGAAMAAMGLSAFVFFGAKLTMRPALRITEGLVKWVKKGFMGRKIG